MGPPYMAKVETIEVDHWNNVKIGSLFLDADNSMGAKDLFLLDDYDFQSEHTIEGKCIVHSFENYNKLENEDYLSACDTREV